MSFRLFADPEYTFTQKNPILFIAPESTDIAQIVFHRKLYQQINLSAGQYSFQYFYYYLSTFGTVAVGTEHCVPPKTTTIRKTQI